MELCDTPARNLDKFIEDHLLPDTRFRLQIKQAIDIICSFLKEKCFQHASHSVRVSKVVKGGSSGKGTTLRGHSDADLVVFLSHLRSFQEQFDRRREFIQEIRKQLEACQRDKIFAIEFEVQNQRFTNPRALGFVLKSPTIHDGVEFDVLPAFDVLGQVTDDYIPDPQIYVDLIQECEHLKKEGEFSTCFTELQRAFLRQRPPKLKSLIRLVKHWYKKFKEKCGESLPPQYALELLTVYAWERGSKKTEFNTAQGFKTVLELVRDYQQLWIYWPKYYNFENPVICHYLMKQLQKPRPVILDPADPTGNLGGGDRHRWQRLAQEAETWLGCACFKNHDGSPVDSWDIQGGSSGQGTALRGGFDSELVIFLDCFKSYKDQGLLRPEILKEMQALLKSWCQHPVPSLSLEFPQRDTPKVLQFRLASTDLENWMDVSLVPAFDALGVRLILDTNCRPIILDPADPTGNLGHNARWDLLAKEATACMTALCCMGREGNPIQPWPMKLSPQQPAGAMGNSAQSSMPTSMPTSVPTSMRTSTRTSMPTQELDAFIQKFLRPFEDCQKQIDEAVDTICAALHETKEFLVTDVAKGGSYGRETVLRGHSDGTLVIFISDLETFTDQKKIPYEIVHKIWNWLKHCQFERKLAAKIEILMSSSGPVVELSTTGQSMTFKVLPAFDALGLIEKPSPWTYRELKSSLDMTKASPGEFSVCFAKLQQNFFNNHPRKLKDLILLVKYWYQQCEEVFMIPLLLSSYALELLTVYAWEQGCGAEDFEIVEGIRTVLGLIQQSKHLCVYWTVNYNFEDETVRNIVLDQIQARRPVILDPTDPTNNVSKEYRGWFLQLEAERWLSRLNESPGPSWNVLPSSLRETPDYRLDEFIKDFLQPSEDFLNQIHKAVGIICSFLEENCFRHSTTKVQKVVQGGSAGKGTTLKTGSDADFVVFTTSLNSYTSQNTERCKIIKEIHEQLEAGQQEEKFKVKFEISKRKFPRVLSFSLKSKQFDESIDFDVLPAFNALDKWKPGSSPGPQVYTDLISLYNSSKIVGGEFSTCFTELQRDFVISRPTKLKDLIRLVKHWYKQCEKKLKKKGSLPPKYALELLTIYAWEQGSGLVDFDTAEGFRTVLELIRQHQQLCIFWTVNYNFEDVLVRDFLLTQLQKTRPVILDPAEPTGDVGGGDRWCWHLLAKEATEWLSFPCLIDNNGHPVQFWNVPVRII